jgi:hypothetical protein
MMNDHITKLLLVAIAGGLWLNFATAPIRAGAQDYNQEIAFISGYVAAIANGNCANPVICKDFLRKSPESLGSRIENELKDLGIAKARAFKADQERTNAICTTMNCEKPEPRTTTPSQAACNTGSC